MNRIILLLFFIFTSTGHIFSQDFTIRQARDLIELNKVQMNNWNEEVTLDDIEGSPYLNDEFIKGSVIDSSNIHYVDVPLRYNIFNKKIEFKLSDGPVQVLADPDRIERVEYGEIVLENTPFLNGSKVKNEFLLVKEKGNASLYAMPEVYFEAAKAPGAYQDAVPARFLKRPNEYYIRVNSEPAVLMKRKKDLSEVFPDHKKEIESFINKNNVKPNKEESLTELVQYYNSLN